MKPLPPRRTLLVGAGRIARRHAAAIADLPERFTLIGLVDPRFEQERGRDPLSPHEDRLTTTGAPLYGALDAALLEQLQPDLVVLCSPSGLHHAMARLAMEGGASVLCEKPVALSSAELAELVGLAERSNTLLIPAHQTRTFPSFTNLRRWLHHDQLLGALHTVNLTLQLCRPQAYFDEVPWRGTLAQDGGVLWNQAIHLIDWMVDLIACEPEQVFSLQSTLRRTIEAPDHASILFTFPGGVANISTSVLAEPCNFFASLDLLGDLGAVRLGGPGACQILDLKLSPNAPRAITRDEVDAINRDTELAITQAHQRLYRRVFAQLQGESPALDELTATLENASRVARLIELAATSAREQRLLPWSQPLLSLSS